MSLNTLTHDILYAIPEGVSLQAEEARRNRSGAYVVGLMLFLVFAPMLAMHYGCKTSGAGEADQTVYRPELTVQPRLSPKG